MTVTSFIFYFVIFMIRALNEMWKCQNLLRHQVKDLVDLIKQTKVSSFPSEILYVIFSRLQLDGILSGFLFKMII